MRALIIDDEEDVRITLKLLQDKYLPQVKIVGEANNVSEGVEIINALKPDLLFLDLEMPDGTGFDLLDNLLGSTKVIFITAHSEYALKAFKYSAVDYLLKPVDALELVEAVNRARQISDEQHSLTALKDNLAESTPSKLVLKDMNSIYLVNLGDIVRCESDNYYTTFHLINGEAHVISKPLKYYEQLLDNRFVRVHQTHLINFDFVKQLDRQEGGQLVMHDGSLIPISGRKKEYILNHIRSLGLS